MLNTNIRVLIVDDFPTMRRIIRGLLRQIGYESIDEAEDGVQALKKLNSSDYNLILSDWNMPNMEGIDLLRAVKKNESLKDLPFILITAEAEKLKIIEAIKAGVDNYIVKPFTADILREKIEKVAQKKTSLLA